MYKKYISTFFSILPKPISNFQSSGSFHLHNSQALFPSFELECCIKETLLNSFRSYCTPMKLRSGDPLETEDAIVQRRGTFFGRCTLQEATTGRENRLEVWYMHAYSVSILGVHTSSLFNWDLRGRVPYAASSRAPKASPGDHVDVGTSSRKGLAFDGTEPWKFNVQFLLEGKGGCTVTAQHGGSWIYPDVRWVLSWRKKKPAGRGSVGGLWSRRLLYKLDEVRSCARCRLE